MKQTVTINLSSFAFGAITTAAVAVGVAYAVIPDASGLISGCWQKNSGQLRVIDPGNGGKCLGSELALTWNQVGPTGPQGAPGPSGPQGSQGAPGTFTGKFTSPNGKFSLVVDDNGIFLTTPRSWISMYDGYTDLEIAYADINRWHSYGAVVHYGDSEYHYERYAYHNQSFVYYDNSYQYHHNVYRYFDGSSYEYNYAWHNYFANLEAFNFKNP